MSLRPEMELKSILLLLGIFLVVASKVSSYDEDLKIQVQGNYAKGPAPPVAASEPKAAPSSTPTVPVVKAPPPAPFVKSPYYPPLVKSPSHPPPPPPPPLVPSPPPLVKSPPAPLVKSPYYPPPPPAPSPSPPTPIVKSTKDCIPLCSNRCQLHSRTRVCMRACMTCCDRCKCVPPGTYGNRDKCGKCYTGMTTHGNRPKCP